MEHFPKDTLPSNQDNTVSDKMRFYLDFFQYTLLDLIDRVAKKDAKAKIQSKDSSKDFSYSYTTHPAIQNMLDLALIKARSHTYSYLNDQIDKEYSIMFHNRYEAKTTMLDGQKFVKWESAFIIEFCIFHTRTLSSKKRIIRYEPMSIHTTVDVLSNNVSASNAFKASGVSFSYMNRMAMKCSLGLTSGSDDAEQVNEVKIAEKANAFKSQLNKKTERGQFIDKISQESNPDGVSTSSNVEDMF